MKSKAIGLRVPLDLWEQVIKYGCQNFPKESDEGKDFDITATLLDLINKGLGNDDVEQFDQQSVEHTVENLVNQNVKQVVKQELDEELNNLLDNKKFIEAIASKLVA
jgi:hypothetical protein